MDNIFIQITPNAQQAEFAGVDVYNTPLKEIGSLSRVNLFVGANNSRKSRFCRQLLAQKEYFVTERGFRKTLNELMNCFQQLKAKKFPNYAIRQVHVPAEPEMFATRGQHLEVLKDFATYHSSAGLIELNSEYFEVRLVELNRMIEEMDDKIIGTLSNHVHSIRTEIDLFSQMPEIVRYQNIFSSVYKIRHTTPPQSLDEDVLNLLRQSSLKLAELAQISIAVQRPSRVYIPTLRGATQVILPSLGRNADEDSYERTVRVNYSIEEESIKVETGLNLYRTIKELRNARRHIRLRFDEFERFLSRTFFEGKQVDIVAMESTPTIQVWIGEGEDRELHNYGDGIQALILMMFPIFMCDNGAWIFIEEPEIHLHPGFQTLFMRTLLTDQHIVEKKLRIFITTHSNHLLDNSILSADVSIFTLTLESGRGESQSFVRQVEGGDVHILDSLGIANSSVFLAQCTIWVEGVTDRLIIGSYIESYMNKLGKAKFILDIHYTFLEYAGSNIRHYLFEDETTGLEEMKRIRASAIGNRMWLLADEDAMDDSFKQQRHEDMRSMTTDNFVYTTTGAREIENTLPWSIIADFLVEELGIPREVVNAKRIDENSYRNERMGKFLSKNFQNELGGRKLMLKGGVLATYYKNKLAEYVYRQNQLGKLNYDILSRNAEAHRIVQSLYGFMSRNCRL